MLQDALAEGRITLEELDGRLDEALQARTYVDPWIVPGRVRPRSLHAQALLAGDRVS